MFGTAPTKCFCKQSALSTILNYTFNILSVLVMTEARESDPTPERLEFINNCNNTGYKYRDSRSAILPLQPAEVWAVLMQPSVVTKSYLCGSTLLGDMPDNPRIGSAIFGYSHSTKDERYYIAELKEREHIAWLHSFGRERLDFKVQPHGLASLLTITQTIRCSSFIGYLLELIGRKFPKEEYELGWIPQSGLDTIKEYLRQETQDKVI